MRGFAYSRALLLVGSLVGSVVAVALFGHGLYAFAQPKAVPELIWEMRFEHGKAEVVKNEIGRLKREGKLKKFPVKAVTHQKEKKVVWLDEDGEVRKERTFEDAKRLLVSQDGRFFGIARRDAHEGPFELEYFDEEGRSLWREWIGDVIYISPTGETIVGGDILYGEHLTFIDSQGAVRKYRDFLGEAIPVFSADGQYVFCKIHQKDNHYVALFDSKGNMVWKRYEGPPGEMYIYDVAISSDGRYVAAALKKSGIIYMSVLDIDGNVLWERTSENSYEIDFSEDEKQIAGINKRERSVVIFRAADGKAMAAYEDPLPQGLILSYTHMYLLNSGRCLFGIYGKNKSRRWLVDLRLYDKKGEQLWNASFPVDASEVEWIPYDKALAMKGGSSFKVFGLWDLDQ